MTVARLTKWCDAVIAAGEVALTSRPADGIMRTERFDDVPPHALGRAWGHRRWVRRNLFDGTISGRELKKYSFCNILMVGAVGLEPTTRGLKVRCSTD